MSIFRLPSGLIRRPAMPVTPWQDGPAENAGQPSFPPVPDAGTPDIPWHKRTRNRLAALALLVIAALIAAVAIFASNGGSASVIRAPFVQALAALAKAPGVRYQDDEQYTGYYDVTVTANGERFGYMGETASFTGQDDQALVTVGGRDFTSFKNDPSTAGWTYNPEDDAKNTSSDLAVYVTPARLAAVLTQALNQAPTLPAEGDKTAASVSVNGTPAWKAVTVDGDIYVTQRAPYRVLRWVPPSSDTVAAAISAKAADPTASIPRSVQGTSALSGSLGMDITPITDATALYGTVIKDTKSLSTATAGFSVQIVQTDDSSSNVLCSSSGCKVNVAFSGPVYDTASAPFAMTDVYVDLTVGSITTGGEQVGGCTSGPQTYQLTGSTLTGSLTCDNPQAGATFDKVNAEGQATANADGSDTFYDYATDINLTVYVFNSSDIDQLVAKEQQELQTLTN